MWGGAQRHARRTAPPSRPGLPAQQPVGLRHPSLSPSLFSLRQTFPSAAAAAALAQHPARATGREEAERGAEGGGREVGCERRCWPLPPALFSPPDAGGTPLWHFLISRDYRCSYLRAAMMLDSSLEDGPSSQHPYSLHSPSLSLFVSSESRPFTVAGRSSSVGGAAVGPPTSLPSLSPVPRSVLLPVPPLPSLCGVSFGVLPACRCGAPFFPLLYADPTPC